MKSKRGFFLRSTIKQRHNVKVFFELLEMPLFSPRWSRLAHSWSTYERLTSGVNFINITFSEQLLHSQIRKAQKKDWQLDHLFCAFGICVKAACKTLMKLTMVIDLQDLEKKWTNRKINRQRFWKFDGYKD